MKVQINRILSVLIIITLLIGQIPATVVSGSEMISGINIGSEVGEYLSEIREAQEDAKSPYSSNPWGLARKDKCSWNYFHNEVKNELVKRYYPNLEGEHRVYYNGQKLNTAGNYGQADICQIQGIAYLWEIKPISYAYEPKKSKGEAQLAKYVATDPIKYKVGGNQIAGDTFTREKTVNHGTYKEHVRYTIRYDVHSNGLILYSFTRQSLGKEVTETATVMETNKATLASKTAKLENIINRGNSNWESEVELGLTMGRVLSSVATARRLRSFHAKVNSSPDTNNTWSGAIVAECDIYLFSVGTIMLGAAIGGVTSPEEVYAEELNDALNRFEGRVGPIVGTDIFDALLAAFEDGDEDTVEAIIKKIQNGTYDFEKATTAQPPRDPLVIDLGNDGIELHSIENGVNFDLDNNGFAEKTAWVGNSDGFLALDRNGNGIIDNGGELFGDQVILIDGTQSSSGFEALSDWDDNADDTIDNKDAVFNKLLVWTDTNRNGVSEAGELKSLYDSNIVSISLVHEEVSFVDDETGARIAEKSSVTINTGAGMQNVSISEFWFPINSSDTTQGGVVTAGNVPDINMALFNDETGKLSELCDRFGESEDIAEKRFYIKKILYFITGAENVDPDSRGGNMDARDLWVVEQFMGREFEGIGGSNPNSAAANILKDLYSDIESRYFTIMNMYSEFGGYMSVVFEYEDDNSDTKLCLSFINTLLTEEFNNGEDVTETVYDLGVYLKLYDEINSTHYFNEYAKYYSALSADLADAVELSKSGITYIGTEGNDYYYGNTRNDFIFGFEGKDILNGSNGIDIIYAETGNDTVYGGAGNDRIYGNAGDDLLDGGYGNDVIVDDGGNDTYVFTGNYGNDVVYDNGGSNALRLNGLAAKDILVNGTGESDITITIKGTNDSLVIKNFREDEALADYILEFKDEKMHCMAENSPFKHIYGTDGDDVLNAAVNNTVMHAFGGDDTVTASDGDDIIYGNDGNDIIGAGAGRDMVYGGTGSDRIDGGAGNDYLYGGTGDDTYVFGNGYGLDFIEDEEGVTTVRLSEELLKDSVMVYLVGNEAVLRVNSSEDMLIIGSYGNNPDNYYLEVAGVATAVKDLAVYPTEDGEGKFDAGIMTIIAGSDLYDYITGSDESELITGAGETDRILAGAGNDIIYGDAGNDQLYGDEDNDVIMAGSGNDYVNSGAGDDVVVLSAGDDFVDGGVGNDTYFYNVGDGCDQVMDSEGENRIVFGDGITSDGIKAYRENWNDLLITFEGLEDTLIIKNYCVDEAARNFKLVFADGSVYVATDEESALRNINDKTGTEFMPSIYANGITIISTNGNDELTGSEAADTLIGGDGNNRISGNGGDDSIDGGIGRDYLYGGQGLDTYIYKKGYGTDTISDSFGNNNIEIEGYSMADAVAYRTNWNDVTLVLDGSGEAGLYSDEADKVVLEGFFTTEAARRYYIAFDNVGIYATSGNSPIRKICGTVNDDYMEGFDNSNITLSGLCGNDTLNGANGADVLYGGAGDDRLLGFAGKDTLDGESGNDYLNGGAGDDTYVFHAGSGNDTINDNQGENVIRFGDGIVSDGVMAYRSNWNDLMLTFAGIEDRLIIQGYFTCADNRKFNVEFADGTKYEYTELSNPINKVYISDADDWVTSWSDDGISINAMAGNDNVTGGAGNDCIAGGIGNDCLYGGDGNDIYVYTVGDGCDIIKDVQGSDVVRFVNLTSQEVTLACENADGQTRLVLMINETGESVVINSFVEEIFVFEFADGKNYKVTVADEMATFVLVVEEEQTPETESSVEL